MVNEWKMIAPIAVGAQVPEEYYHKFLQEAGKWHVTHILFTLLGERNEAYWLDGAERIRKLRPLFEDAGIRTGIWIGYTIGHGGAPVSEPGQYTRLVTSNLTAPDNCYCPLDEDFRAFYAKVCAILAGTGCEYIMIDDDFRLGMHTAAAFGCFCELHLAAFAEKYGRKLSAEELLEAVKKDFEVRKLWLEVNAKSLEDTLKIWGEAAVKANPNVRMGIATAMTLLGSDGTVLPELLYTFNPSGNKPFFRTIGAPYWANRPQDLIFSLEYNRLQLEKLKEFERWCEGDTYPRNLFNTPAAYLGAYCDGVYLAGSPGVQAYTTNYMDPKSYEPRYTSVMVDFAARKRVWDDFRNCESPFYGFEPVAPFDAIRTLDLKKHNAGWADKPLALSAFAEFGIPQTYDDPSAPVILMGSGIGALSDDELRAYLERSAFIDAVAAKLLYERGFDIGAKPAVKKTISSEMKEVYSDGTLFDFSAAHFEPWEGGKAVSRLEDGTPVVLQTVSASGKRFVIVPFDLSMCAQQPVWRNRQRAAEIRLCAEYLLGKPLVLQIDDFPPFMHVLQKGDQLALQNCSLERIGLDEIKLAAPYKLKSVTAPYGGEQLHPTETVLIRFE